jgi:putative transposase
MPDTYSQIYLHIVFAVKFRDRVIPGEHKEELHKFITGIVTNSDCKLVAINSVADHVHLLIGMNPNVKISDLVRDIKSNSSRFMNEEKWLRGKFQWQEGFGAFSNGRSQLDGVVKYIMNQENHHRRKTFKEEYLTMLEKFAVVYDAQYLFEFFDRGE